jgi:hypothetical protein
MIAAVSPSASAADHTQNTLRYADRVKEKPEGRVAEGSYAGLGGPVETDLAFLQKPGDRRHPVAFTKGRAAEHSGSSEDEEDSVEQRSKVRLSPVITATSPAKEPVAVAAPRRSVPGGIASGQARSRPSLPSASTPRGGAGTVDPPARDHVERPRARVAERSPLEPFPSEKGLDDDDGLESPDAGVAAEFLPMSKRSSPHKDLEILHATLKRDGDLPEDEDEADPASWMRFHEVMDRIVEEEEELLSSHMSAIQENAHILTEEGQLLSRVQGRDVVDYDIDGYAERLDAILRRKLQTTQALLDRLTTFRRHLQFEDEMARAQDAAAVRGGRRD